MKRLLLVLALVGCATVQGVKLPDVIAHTGGTYLPWHERGRAERADVLSCVGLDTLGALPSLWIARKPLVRNDELLMAYYDFEVHAVVFSPIVSETTFWPVFRHEMIHSKERLSGHGQRFSKPDSCRFWPSRPSKD